MLSVSGHEIWCLFSPCTTCDACAGTGACEAEKCAWDESGGFGQCKEGAAGTTTAGGSTTTTSRPSSVTTTTAADITATTTTTTTTGGSSGGDCSKLDNNGCFGNSNCAVDQDTSLCRDKQCRDFFDQTGCEGSGLCEYDGSNFVCFVKGEQPLCSQLFDASSCGDRSDCEYVTDAFLCKVKGSKTPCRVFFEQGMSCTTVPPPPTCYPNQLPMLLSSYPCQILFCTHNENSHRLTTCYVWCLWRSRRMRGGEVCVGRERRVWAMQGGRCRDHYRRW